MSGPNAAAAGAAAGVDFKARVLQATDIVELIGATVPLKRRGKDFVGLCPFHQEKTPSFHVSPARQFFHCYGCKAGGNAIDFVMKRDRVEFLDALRALGERVGLEMPRRGGASNEKAGERQQLLEACSAAGTLFEKLLVHPEQGKDAREYLSKRGFTAESIQRFRIGFAPDAWDALLRSPLMRKFPPPVLAVAGLVKPRQSGEGYYDTFRNRVIFPIRDENGRVIAFGGRVMPGSQDPAKYLNSPETPLFSKGRSIFGLDLARQRVVETRTVAVVEGYTDVVMAHQYGVHNVVSILGTAMTEQHVTTLRRFADRIVLLFDADEAGETAVNRTVELFMTQPVDFAIASMPQGVDPDEFLLAHGAAGFQKLLDEAPPVLQFMVRQFKRRWKASEGNIPVQERALQDFMAPFVKARAERAVDDNRWAAVLSTLGKELEVPTAELHRRYGRLVRQTAQQAAQKAAQVPRRGEPTNTAPAAPRPAGRSRSAPTAQETAERRLLGVLLIEPSRWQQVQQHVDVADFTEDLRRRLAEAYWSHQRDEGEPVFSEFLSDLRDPALAALAIELVEEVESLPSPADTMSEAVLHLEEQRRRREGQKLVARLRRNDDQLGEQDQVSLLKQLQDQARQGDLRRVGS